MTGLKLVILGRDGILNRFREDHVKGPDEFEVLPGAFEAVARLNHAGWHTVVATNQAGIGRGVIDIANLNAVHQQMMKVAQQKGARLDAVFFCPHTTEEGCDCRKPRPGLFQDIGERYGIALGNVPVVGDTLRDLQAAQAAGCPAHLVLSGRAAGLNPEQRQAVLEGVPGAVVHEDLGAFVTHWLAREASARAAQATPSPTPPTTDAAATAGAP